MLADKFKICGNRVFLRKMNEADADSIVLWRNDPEIKKWMFSQEDVSVQTHSEWFSNQNESNRLDYMICDMNTKKPIGTVNYVNIGDYTAEAGKLLGDKAYWGLGYAKEAFRLWLSYGFSQLKFKKIYVRTMINNVSNIKLNTNLGFSVKEESVFRIDNKVIPILVMEIFQDDLL
jgi:RimJ/RimL family protein N-acetyltransferase